MDVDDDGDTAEKIPLDVAGKPRFRDDPYTDDTGVGPAPIVDIGAYEYQLISRFGTVDGKNIKLPLTDGTGNVVTFGLTLSFTGPMRSHSFPLPRKPKTGQASAI
jgi:hypothetical protein